MGQFEITRARQQLGFTPSASAPLSADVRGTGGTGGAIGQALIGAAQIWEKYDIQQAQTQLNEAQRKAQAEMNDLKIRLKGNLDPDTYDQEYAKTRDAIQRYAPKNKRAAQAFGEWAANKDVDWGFQVATAKLSRAEDNWDAEMAGNIAELETGANPEALARTEAFLAERQLGPNPMDKTKAGVLLSEARKAHQRGVEATIKNNVKSQYMTLIDNGGSKQDAYAIVQNAAKETGMSPELKETLTNNVDSYWAGHINNQKKAKANGYVNAAKGFIDGSITANTVQELGLMKSQEDRDYWDKIFLATQEESIPKTKEEGYETTRRVESQSQKGLVTTEGAVRELLDARYINKTITDKELKSSLNRVLNPYPDDYAKQLEGLMMDMENNITRSWWYDEELKAQEAQSNILDWIDREKARTDEYPDLKDVYVQVKKSDLFKKINLPAAAVQSDFKRKWEMELSKPPVIGSTYYISASDTDKYESLPNGFPYYNEERGEWMIKNASVK